jgi:hypothetical protein
MNYLNKAASMASGMTNPANIKSTLNSLPLPQQYKTYMTEAIDMIAAKATITEDQKVLFNNKITNIIGMINQQKVQVGQKGAESINKFLVEYPYPLF